MGTCQTTWRSSVLHNFITSSNIITSIIIGKIILQIILGRKL